MNLSVEGYSRGLPKQTEVAEDMVASKSMFKVTSGCDGNPFLLKYC